MRVDAPPHIKPTAVHRRHTDPWLTEIVWEKKEVEGWLGRKKYMQDAVMDERKRRVRSLLALHARVSDQSPVKTGSSASAIHLWSGQGTNLSDFAKSGMYSWMKLTENRALLPTKVL